MYLLFRVSRYHVDDTMIKDPDAQERLKNGYSEFMIVDVMPGDLSILFLITTSIPDSACCPFPLFNL